MHVETNHVKLKLQYVYGELKWLSYDKTLYHHADVFVPLPMDKSLYIV